MTSLAPFDPVAQGRQHAFVSHRSKAQYKRDGADVGFGTFESRLLDQKCRNDPVVDLQDGREQIGMGGSLK